MKAKQARESFLVPGFVGQSEPYMAGHDMPEQLDLFLKALTRRGKVQVLAMLALSDPKHLDNAQETKIADIARTMGYDPYVRSDGKEAFQPWVYDSIEETGMHLRQNYFDVHVRELVGDMKDGRTKGGRRKKWKNIIVNLAILQEFGFYYEDEDGQPINLDEMPKDQLIEIETPSGLPRYAIPIIDENGQYVRNEDGTIRRRMANGVTWTWATRFAKLGQNKNTAWLFYREAVAILRRYLSKEASFDLMFMTLFHRFDGQIERSHDKLIRLLNIRSKDPKQVQTAIDAAFQDALNEGIIDKPVTITPAGHYKPTKKSGKPRRKDMVYRWQPAARWRTVQRFIELDTEEKLTSVHPERRNA